MAMTGAAVLLIWIVFIGWITRWEIFSEIPIMWSALWKR